MIQVSIIIPAYNAAKTLEETIASLFAQSYSAWEGIIIDDGSEDETATIAKSFAEQDSRIRVVSQSNSGVCAARNLGISLAQYDWLLFLDADDWIAPEYLERMTGKLSSDSSLDAVHCGWYYVAIDGTCFSERYGSTASDLFPVTARQCPFVIHACIVRKAIVESVSAFDPTLRACEDWDLWQRIARTGARFGAVAETLAFYRLQPHSLSKQREQFVTDAMHVLHRGHAPDPRVQFPHPAYTEGQPSEKLPAAKLSWLTWLAGLWLSRGEDASHLLELLDDKHTPDLEPIWIAKNILDSILYTRCQSPTACVEQWASTEPLILNFLSALEEKLHTLELARRTSIILERLILQHANASLPFTIGSTHGVRIEVSEAISDIFLPEGIDRLYCLVELEGKSLGTLELPVCDRVVSRYVLLDAIVANFSFTWTILGRFFTHTVYNKTRNTDVASAENLHDQVGWETFLRELWGQPNWSNEQFYDPALVEAEASQTHAEAGWLTIEISQDLPNVKVTTSELNVVPTIGGAAAGIITIPVKQNFVSAQQLRVALTSENGQELCRVCVREALLGRSLRDAPSLRMRLVEAAQSKQQPEEPSPDAATLPLLNAETLTFPDKYLLTAPQNTLFLGRRLEAMGTSASRRAALPVAAMNELLDSANETNELVVPASQRTESFEQTFQRVIYAPELISQSPSCQQSSAQTEQSFKAVQPGQSSFNPRDHFETLFATQPDPWKYTSSYEQVKYEQTLSLLPPIRIERALELACAEGHFTIQLAPQVDSLIAADISQIALDRAAQRCANSPNVSFMHLDLSRDLLPGRFQLIVCSEVLYYMGDWKALQAFAQRVADALEPGGYFLTAHANLVVDEPDRPGFTWPHPFGAKGIGDTFASINSLQLIKELRTPLYRVQLFQRQARSWFPFRKKSPEIIELPQPTPPPERVAHAILWNGGELPHYEAPPIVTDRLPILMYHRVAPTGSAQLDRWRVTPQAFEEQLRYLRDAGYYSITLEAWRRAVTTRQPLPGRAILITFDDGYLDFFTYAYPLLKQYGFSAMVFLVTEQVGQTNSWDAVYSETLSLMDWQQIRQLQADGIEFGSHSASHRPLTALSNTEIVQEGARSRAVLQQELGRSTNVVAYPYGDTDPVVEHLMGACGYVFGLTCRSGFSTFYDPLLALPRIEVSGFDSLQEFVVKLSEQ